LRDFYERAIGLRALSSDDGITVLGTGGGALVELVSAPEAPVRPRGTTGLFHLAIRYPSRRSLADALRRLTEAGVSLSGASDHGVSEALYLADPDGNGIELYWDRPREDWPEPQPGQKVEMFVRPLDVSDLLAELDS